MSYYADVRPTIKGFPIQSGFATIPENSRIIGASAVDGLITLYAECVPIVKSVRRDFAILRADEITPENGVFVAMITMDDFAFFVYEIVSPKKGAQK